MNHRFSQIGTDLSPSGTCVVGWFAYDIVADERRQNEVVRL